MGHEIDGLRPEIERSWRRSALSGVTADHLDPVAVDGVEDDHRVLRAGQPVLNRLGDALSETRMSLVLTDSRAAILGRWAGSADLHDVLDGVGVAPGFSYAEDQVGTNGMGTAVEERRPVKVVGEEHFAEPLKDLTCVGVPIVNPVTGRVEGVLDLTCFNGDASPLLLPLLREAVRDVEARLGDTASPREQLLMQRFLRTSRRTARPVVSVGDQVVITNGAAARLLGPEDHLLLWASARRHLVDLDRAETSLVLTSGQLVRVRADGVRDDGELVGAVLALDATDDSDADDGEGALPGLVGRSAAWRRACGHALALGDEGDGVLVVGERGTGRAEIARAISHQRGYGEPMELDGSAADVGSRAWFGPLGAGGTRAVLVRRIDALEPSVRAALLDRLAAVPADRRLATSADARDAALLGLAPGSTVHVPPLRERLDDLPLLVGALARRHDPQGRARITSPVLQALLRCPWSGNVAELDDVIGELLRRRPLGDVTVDDLPRQWRPETAPHPLSAMERAEYDAIVTALLANDGNRVTAAKALGIARSTLYRKLASYGIS